MRTPLLFAIAAGTLLGSAHIAMAQGTPSSRGTTGTASSLGIGSSMFGASNTGGATGAGIGATGFGSSFGSFGSQGGVGSTGGQGGIGQSGFGQTGFGQTGVGNTGFLGANTTGGFIGRTTQGQTGNLQNSGMQNRGGTSRGGQGQQNLMSLLGGLGAGGGGQGGQTSTTTTIRPRQKVAFDFPQPSATKIQTSVQTQLTGISRRYSRFERVEMAVSSGGEVVLTGSVPTERDARLVENLARLEPGVRSVRNELTYPAASGSEGD